MTTKPGTRNFGGPIPEGLKDRIDAKLAETKVPAGIAVERLAEWLAEMDLEEIKNFCYGTNALTFTRFIRQQVEIYLRSPEGIGTIDEIVATRLAQSPADKQQRRADRVRKSA